MKKRLSVITLLLVMMFTISVQAAQPRASIVPGLTFTGTTANCSVTVISNSDQIYVELSLWNGSTKVDSWEASGTTYVSINETCAVVAGQTYTLKVNGSINNVAFSEETVTKTC